MVWAIIIAFFVLRYAWSGGFYLQIPCWKSSCAALLECHVFPCEKYAPWHEYCHYNFLSKWLRGLDALFVFCHEHGLRPSIVMCPALPPAESSALLRAAAVQPCKARVALSCLAASLAHGRGGAWCGRAACLEARRKERQGYGRMGGRYRRMTAATLLLF